MPQIRSLASISKKWKDRAQSAGPQYADGVATPKKDWQAATAAAANNWEAGVTEAARNKSFNKGVAQSSTAKWQAKSQSKGVQRFAPGVAEAEPDYSAGFDKFQKVIESTQLPQKFAKGDPRNLERVKVMSMALRKAKTQ